MTRKYIDCREFPGDTYCSVAISADSEEELLEVAVQHAISAHKHEDSPELRSAIRGMIKDGMPPELVVPPGAAAGAAQGAHPPHPH
jgi:predicted small metal-binding protein